VYNTAARMPNWRLEVSIHLATDHLELRVRDLPRTWSKCWLSAQIFHVAMHATYAADQIRAQRNKHHGSRCFSSAQTWNSLLSAA
jgi:hypothetical protein